MEVVVTIAKNEEKLIRKRCSANNDDCAEKNYASDNRRIKITQFVFVLATRESRNENVDEQIRQDGENHGETSKRSDFGDRRRVTPKETNQEHSDLTLETIKKGVGGQLLD